MDPFERPYWSQLQGVVWVCTRSKGAVRAAADRRPLPSGHTVDGLPGTADDLDLIAEVVMPGGRVGRRWRSRLREGCSFEAAEEEVIDALARGCLRATGLRNGEGDRQEIPREHWADLRFYWTRPERAVNCTRYVGPRDQYRRGAAFWTEVQLESKHMVELWPDPSDNSEGTAETEGNGTRPSQRVRQDDVDKWYRAERLPLFCGPGRDPSRDDDWAAARIRFGSKVTFEMLRRARSKYAPKEAQEAGRRKTVR